MLVIMVIIEFRCFDFVCSYSHNNCVRVKDKIDLELYVVELIIHSDHCNCCVVICVSCSLCICTLVVHVLSVPISCQ